MVPVQGMVVYGNMRDWHHNRVPGNNGIMFIYQSQMIKITKITVVLKTYIPITIHRGKVGAGLAKG